MKRRTLIIISTLIVLLGAGVYVGDRALKSKDHPGLMRFLRQWWVNYPASFAVEPEVIELKVDQADLDAIEGVVEKARERGVIMRDGNDYVSGEMVAEGATFKVKLRIKGKMADHVKGDKWSFRVVAKKDKGFKGMQRFSLQHPGTRNYLCDWFYHRLSRGEGIIALRYGFVKLVFNGEDLGVYAYEEHFGPELLAHNERMKGPIFRFDPGLFWEHRLNMIEKVRYNEAFAAYQAAALDAFGTGDLEKDSVQRRYFEEAVGRMMAFRNGDLRASDVFDADRIARRHALLDLVGGHHSMDWSDVKFYYDPVIKRVEPIAYESFSAFPIRSLAGADRYTGVFKPSMDLHDAYFNDPDIFSAYVQHLERVSEPAFLDSVFTALGPALDSASALIYREFPYKELDRSVYDRNQLIIRRMLDVPKGFHAYASVEGDSLTVSIIPIEALPMELLGIESADGKLLAPAERTIIPCRIPGRTGTPMLVRVALDDAWHRTPPERIMVRFSVLGASNSKTVEAFPYALTDGLDLPDFNAPLGFKLTDEPAFRVDDVSRTINIIPGAHTISHDVFIPEGYTVRATTPLRIDLQHGVRIVSRSPMVLKGLDDAPITIGSSDSSGAGLVLLSTGARSLFSHVRFDGFGPEEKGTPSIIVQETMIDLVDCHFQEVSSRRIITGVRSGIALERCTFTGGSDQVTFAYCNTRIAGGSLTGAADDAVVVKGGQLSLSDIRIDASGSAMVLDEFARATVDASSIAATKVALRISEAASISMSGGRISSTKGSAFKVDDVHGRHGPSKVELKAVHLEGAEPVQEGKGNEVSVSPGGGSAEHSR
jgi:CotH kinase protein